MYNDWIISQNFCCSGEGDTVFLPIEIHMQLGRLKLIEIHNTRSFQYPGRGYNNLYGLIGDSQKCLITPTCVDGFPGE